MTIVRVAERTGGDLTASSASHAGAAGDTVGPDPTGHFAAGPVGLFRGRFVPDVIVPALEQLAQTYLEARVDPRFAGELTDLLSSLGGRPTLITETVPLVADRVDSVAGGTTSG